MQPSPLKEAKQAKLTTYYGRKSLKSNAARETLTNSEENKEVESNTIQSSIQRAIGRFGKS